MFRYESYKDSGVKWLGEIPSHWEVKKLRAFFDRRNQKVSDKDYAPLSVTKNGIVPQMENVAKSKDSDNRRLVKVGDFVINSRSDRKGSSGVSQLEGSVSFVNTVFTPKGKILPSFSNYLLKSISFIEENYRNGHGIVADLWTTSFEEQKHIYLAVPPKEEQEDIVEYLDKVTGDIDKAIEAQQKLIEALNERKQIVITNAVTKGLDPTVQLKDSGIDWLGQIPKHWEVRKLKTMCIKIMDGTHFSPSITNEGFPYITATDVDGIGFDYNTVKRISERDFLRLKKSGCEALKGDVLIVKDGATTGRVGLKNDEVPCVTLSSVAMLRPSKSIMMMFLYYLLESSLIKEQISISMAGAALPRITLSKLSNFQGILPPLSEQSEIIQYIESTIDPLNRMRKSCERMISLLQERKQIIINDVVTGKKKVI